MKPKPATEVLATHTAALFAAAVRRAAELLRAGQLVALPTETVYGLAANAWNPQAVARIFQVKGRPAHNPLIVHVADLDLARQCVRAWPPAAEALAAAFWPGPLTLVLPRADAVPDVVTAGGETVGVRWPSHPLIQAVIRECGFPLAAPSANPSSRISPTTAEHVLAALSGQIPLIVDGGPCQVGIESTVLDLTVRPARVVRPGMIHAVSLSAVLGQGEEMDAVTSADDASGGGRRDVLRSPGQLEKHYAPRAPLILLRWRDAEDLRSQLASRGIEPAACQVLAHGNIPSEAGWGGVSVIPHDAQAYARALYGELHRCDAAGAGCIVVEALPDGPEWQAIADRLRRAAHGR